MKRLVSTIAMLAATIAPAAARDAVVLDQGWRFAFGQQPADSVIQQDFDDSAWQAVALPHTWNHLGEYRQERSAATDNRQGAGWYRLAYAAPTAAKGKRFYLDFPAVGAVADVWVNGVHVGSHAGAFSRFRLDVTAAWKAGAINEIVVRADNAKPAIGSTTQDVLPLGGDFFVHGGLYRGVSLITADEAGIDLLDYGGPGVYASTSKVENGAAVIHVTTRLRNAGPRRHAFDGTVAILDAAGAVVATSSFHRAVAPGAADEIGGDLSVGNPHLWNGRKDPYLYSVRVELKERGRTVDVVTQPLGIRTFRIDPAAGFSLNGTHLRLFGVSRHQDRQGKGWALSEQDHAEDMAMIAEMGANTVRMAHYQHADAWADAADRTGMVAWAEVPFVNTSSLLDGGEASSALTANADQQLRELIRQNYNHPSIMMWSVGNEVDIGARLWGGKRPARSLSLLRHLNEVAHGEDGTRPTTFADCCESGAMGAPAGAEMLAGTTDLIGYNRYFGWYYGKPADLGPALDDYHARHPANPISISEFGAGGALSQHSDNPLGGPINAFGRPHPEEYQSWYHEESWKQIKQRDYVFAAWVWNMFDFASDLREEGDATDINDKGLVSYDRKVRKDAFYFYQAQLSDQPVLHINGRRYADRAYPVIDVRVYSNAPTVSLTLNGAALGTRECPDHICVWPGVALHAGDNEVVATAAGANGNLTDTVHWTAPDARAGLRIDAGDLVGHTSAAGRYGSDNFFTGGTARLLNVAVFRGQQAPPKREVAGAADPLLYTAWREGEATWRLPLPNGKWRVIVHSFEPDANVVDRSFAVSANGRDVAKAFAPRKVAGGALRPADLTFDTSVTTGELALQFRRASGDPVVAAIDVVPVP